jgi:hypothetical protein
VKVAFSIFKKIVILCIFIAACGTATSPWQRVVVSALGLIYISVVSGTSFVLNQLISIQVSNKRRFVELRRLNGHSSPTEPEEEDAVLERLSDPALAVENGIQLFYAGAFVFIAFAQIVIAAIE